MTDNFPRGRRKNGNADTGFKSFFPGKILLETLFHKEVPALQNNFTGRPRCIVLYVVQNLITFYIAKGSHSGFLLIGTFCYQRIFHGKEFARQWLIKIYQNMDVPDKALMLEANYDEHSGESFFIPTNYQREALYNLEHTIHHMALIRVGINEVSTLQVPQEFGVAASTIKHQNTCAR